MQSPPAVTPILVAELLVEPARWPVYVHVIDHPDGRVLVDTGMTELHPAVADLDPRLDVSAPKRDTQLFQQITTEVAMKLSLEDRVVLITGPAKGMGASITHAFAAEGCKLALMGRDTAAIAPVANEVKAHGGKAVVIPCDLTDSKQCDAAIETAKRAFGGRIDILVNVAGGSGPIGKTGVQTTPEEFDEIVSLNMNGCFHTMRAALPTMIDQRYGKVVNVGGTFGMRGRAGRDARNRLANHRENAEQRLADIDQVGKALDRIAGPGRQRAPGAGSGRCSPG